MSDNSKSQSQTNSNPIEAWYLTAYALGELDEASCKEVEAWLVDHPEDRLEIEAIRQTAASVQRELKNSSQGDGLDSTRTQRVQEAITGASSKSASPQVSVIASDSSQKKARQRRFLIAMSTGLAAGLAGAAIMLLGTEQKILMTDTTNSIGPSYSEPGHSLPWVPPNSNAAELATSEQAASQAIPLADGSEPRYKSLASSSAGENFGTDKSNPSLIAGKKASGLEYESKSGKNEEFDRPSPMPSESRPGDVGRFAGGGGGGGLPAGPSGGLGSGANPSSGGKGLGAPAGFGPGAGTAGAGPAGAGLGGAGLGGSMGGQALVVADNESRSPVTSLYSDASKADENLRRLPSDRGGFPEELKQNVPSKFRESLAKDQASGDRFDSIPETPFSSVTKDPLSTFSIDVDTASYSKLRQYVMENHVVPPPAAIRIEEWLNYFDYKYPGPSENEPFAAHMKMGDCPWNSKHKLVRVAIQAKKVANEERPKSNLVFLIDVSGSMANANKLPLVKQTLGLLTSQLREQDRVAIVVYAGASGCVLPSTSGDRKDQILASINELQSGGSTNGGQGIDLAYKIAQENFIPGGVNRVILCTDGDFNVGVTGTDALVEMMQERAKSNIFLTCLGYGIGNYNDSMMEQISNKGNGTYAMVDGETEARRVMTEQLSGTLMTVAKDVKIQIEFNPAKVHSYRLIGYENRKLAAADFNNDKKDAGEIGAGHRVTALYEIVPVGQEDSIPGAIDDLRFSKTSSEKADAEVDAKLSDEWLLLKIRSKQPEASESTKQEFILNDKSNQLSYEEEQLDFDWAVSVAEFGLLMRRSELAPGMDWEKMIARAMDSTGSDAFREECVRIMQRAKDLSVR